MFADAPECVLRRLSPRLGRVDTRLKVAPHWRCTIVEDRHPGESQIKGRTGRREIKGVKMLLIRRKGGGRIIPENGPGSHREWPRFGQDSSA